MKKRGSPIGKFLATAALATLGVLGMGGCKSAQKTKTPPPEQPVIPQRDTIRPPYGEAVAMYGTPYRGFETKKAVPEIDMIQEEQQK